MGLFRFSLDFASLASDASVKHLSQRTHLRVGWTGNVRRERLCVGLLESAAVWSATSALAFVFSVHTQNKSLAWRWAASFAASSVWLVVLFWGLL